MNDPAADVGRPRLASLEALLAPFEADAAKRNAARRSGRPWGPVTGLGKLDDELGGALENGLHVVHGSPGVGKTAFALQIGATCGCPCLYVTAEMSPVELLRRVAARTTGTYLGRLKSGEMAPADALAVVRRGAEAAPLLAIADATTAHAPADWIEEMGRVVRGEHGHLLIVVDSLHSWAEGGADGATEYESLNDGIRGLRGVASRLGCPVLAIAERNRASMRTGGLSAGAGTRGIEYKGESVWDLSADENALPTVGGETPVTLTLEKNRNGSQRGKVALRFSGRLQAFSEA